MNTIEKLFAGASCMVALTACGGGGGEAPGSPSVIVAPVAPPPSADQSWLTVTPASADLVTYDGDALKFTVIAKSGKPLAKPYNAAFIDSAGIISPKLETYWHPDGYIADLKTTSSLKVGTYATNLEVRFCEDEPAICKKPAPGSPWLVPLRVTVHPATNFKGLRAAPFMPNWSTFQGNAAHNGYVPASFDVSKFIRRWSSPVLRDGKFMPIVHDNAKVFAVNSGYSVNDNALVAYDENTAKELWRYDFGRTVSVNPPAAAGGKVYVSSTGVEASYLASYFWVFDQASGQVLSKKRMNLYSDSYTPPSTVFGEAVYTRSGHQGSMSTYSTVNNDFIRETGKNGFNYGVPSVEGNYAYAFGINTLFAIKTADGTDAFSIGDAYGGRDDSGQSLAVLSGKQTAFVINRGNLIAFDLATRSLSWAAPASAVAEPVYAKEVVYVLNAKGAQLDAYAAKTGGLLWSSGTLPSSAKFNQLLVTDTLAFVSSADVTAAIDLNTRKIVWEYPLGGALSISNRGVLYISGAESRKFAAINLE